MKIVVKVLAGLVGLFILANGLLFMFKPEAVIGHAGISINNEFGMSTVRGLIGGTMVATALMIFMALIKSRFERLHPPVWILIGWTVGRIMSLVLDGFDKNVLLSGVLVSAIMAVILTVAHRVLTKQELVS